MGYKSRKFLVTLLQTILIIAIPLAYKHMEVSESLTMTVLIAVAAAGSFYTGFNVLQKKVEGGSNE